MKLIVPLVDAVLLLLWTPDSVPDGSHRAVASSSCDAFDFGHKVTQSLEKVTSVRNMTFDFLVSYQIHVAFPQMLYENIYGLFRTSSNGSMSSIRCVWKSCGKSKR
jgi:hypothetical protein